MTKNILSPLLICFFCFSLLLQSCKKDKKSDPVPAAGTNSNTNDALFYFTGSVDGATKSFIQDGKNDSVSSAAGASNSIGVDYSTFKYSTYVAIVGSLADVIEKESIGIMKGTLKEFSTSVASDSMFFAFFKKGSAQYSTGAANGIEITYFDRNKKEWSTSLGSQTGSTFTFDSIEEDKSLFGSFIHFTASFSCKVYDENGSFKIISNGKMKSSFQNM